MKRLASILLGMAVMLSQPLLAAAQETDGFAYFAPRATYTQGTFSDVSDGAWYEAGVQVAYELGLVSGVGGDRFNPAGNISVAETLALASRMHRIYTTGANDSFGAGEPWFQPYVDYAVENQMIWAGQFSDYTMLATRAEFAMILSAALPGDGWAAINHIDCIPDVEAGAPYATATLKLYNAGVLTGSDRYGTFQPFSNITRGEVATIVTRMAKPEQRVNFALLEKPVEATSVTLTGPDSVYTWDTITLAAQLFPENTTDRSITWNCSDWNVASVSPEGVVTGTQAGTAVISATTANGKVGEKTVTVVKRPAISAPDPIIVHEGVSSDSSILYKDKSGFGFYINSADGVHISWTARNLSGKVINYYTCYYSMYNPVGDPARDQITKKSTVSSKTVGPVQPGDSLIDKGVIGYSRVCDKVVLDKIELEYADGTTETVWYGYSGGETYWDKYNNNWISY